MKPVAILDIGSSKVVCLCGSVIEKDGVVVHGAGVCAYDGFRDGKVTDRHSLQLAITEAVRKAEQESRVRIRDVALSTPSAFVSLALADATITLGNRAREVESADVDRLIALSLKRCEQPEGTILMHSTPVFFMVDGVSSAELPEGVETDELSGLISHMFVRQEFIALISDCLDELGVEISMCISAQLAEAVMLIPDAERVRPAVLIDVGYMQTDVCVIEAAALTGMGSIPCGGYHFSSDLAFGLDVTQDSAEQAKRRFVFSLDNADKTEVLRSESGSKRVSHAAISFIIEARAAELASLIRAEIERLGVNLDARPIVYVSGGGLLMMRGGLDFLKKALNLQLKRDMPWTPRLSSPNYCSAFGALDFVLRAGHPEEGQSEGDKKGQSEPKEGSLLKKLLDFFTK